MRRPHIPTLQENAKAVKKFNETYKTGDAIRLQGDPGRPDFTATVRGEAFVLGGHTAVVPIRYESGKIDSYLLSRVIYGPVKKDEFVSAKSVDEVLDGAKSVKVDQTNNLVIIE